MILSKFSDNAGMTLFFIWYSHKKELRSTSLPETAHLKCLKTYYLLCRFLRSDKLELSEFKMETFIGI